MTTSYGAAQVNIKLGDGTLINICGADMDDLGQNIEEFITTVAPKLSRLGEAVGAVATVGNALGGQVVGTSPAPQVSVAQAQAAPGFTPTRFQQSPPPGPAPIDQFGRPMIWKHFTSKAGKNIKGWFGDYPQGDGRGDQVAPQFVR